MLAHIAEGLIRPRDSLERLLAERPTVADAGLMVVAAYAVQRIAVILLAPEAEGAGLFVHLVSLALTVGFTFVIGFLIHRIGRAFGGHATVEQSLVAAAWHSLVMSLLSPLVVLGMSGTELAEAEPEISPAAFLALALYLAAGVWLLARFAATVHGFRNEWAVVGVILAVSLLLSSLLMALAGG